MQDNAGTDTASTTASPKGDGRDARGEVRAWALAHLLVQGAVFALSFVHARDPDLGFHLATGRAVLALGRVPATNVLSYAEPEAVALNQQWLPATIFELAYRRFDIAGPTSIKCAVLAATFALVVWLARRMGASAAPTALVGVFGAVAAAPRFVERPLLFSNLCLLTVAACVVRVCGDARAGRPRTGALAVAALATAFAVHLHAGALFCFVLLGGAAVADAIDVRLGRHRLEGTAPLHERYGVALGLAGAAVAAFALAAVSLALYHPHGIRVLVVPFTMASDPYLHDVLIEFRPPWALRFSLLSTYWGFALATVLALAVALRRTPLAVLSPAALGLALSLRHVRFLDLCVLLGASLVARVLSQLAQRAPRPALVAYGAGLAAAVATAVTALDMAASGSAGFGYEPAIWPRTLLNEQARLGLGGRAFVQDGWAGPHLGLRYPRERAFFHPNFESYTPRFFREVYMRTRDGEPGWDATLERFGVSWVLMKYTSPGERARQRGRPNLRQRLVHDPRWALVAFDTFGELFARRDTLTPAQQRAVIEGVDPDTQELFGDPEVAFAAMRGLEDRGLRSVKIGALDDLIRAARRARVAPSLR